MSVHREAVEAAGKAALDNLMDRSGVGDALWQVDDEVREEICISVGYLAILAYLRAMSAAGVALPAEMKQAIGGGE